jgi:CTP synthase (UTP-ammonia lyase)
VKAPDELTGKFIAVIGDRVEGHPPQDAIAPAIEYAATFLGVEPPDVRWVATKDLRDDGARLLEGAAGAWGAPGGPFASMSGALDGIRWARETGVPFLGTCGGFQLGVVEFARNVLGHAAAAHAEYDPSGEGELFIDELLCSLVGQTMHQRIVNDEMVGWYETSSPVEQYCCRFGLHPRWRDLVHDAGLRVAAVDSTDGDVRVLRLEDHPLFVLTLFVPQTRSTAAAPHPLIRRFLETALDRVGNHAGGHP